MTDSREAFLFKQATEGYVFRAPNLWVFGRARFFLVNEQQKAQLLAIMTARSLFVFWTIFCISFVVMFATAVVSIAFISGQDDPSIADVVIMVVLVPVLMYAALLISVHPTARRVQPLLADLSPTDHQITAADLRRTAQRTTLLPAQFTLVASQVILSATFVIQAMQKAGGNLASVFDNGSVFSFAFAGACFAVSSIVLLIAALKRFKHRQEETVPAEKSFRKFLLPGFSLAISIVALGLTIYLGERGSTVSQLQSVAAERRQKSVEIRHRLTALEQRMEKSDIAKRQVSMKTRTAANSARMNTLIDKFNNSTVKCETVASIDDPSRLENARICTERARQERQAVQAEIEETRKEGDALWQKNATLQQEVAEISAEMASIRAENDANR